MYLSKNSLKTFALLLICFSMLRCKNEDQIPKPQLPPTILSISPKTGQPGTLVKIRGNNFSKNKSENHVKFNDVTAELLSASDTLLEVLAPQSSSGVVEVSVKSENLVGPDFKYYNIYCFGRNNYYAAYWKDGIPTNLVINGFIHDMAISDQDIHAIGWITDNGRIPMYWENGQSVELEDLTENDELIGICTSGKDIYICGTRSNEFPYHKTLRYWKNGSLIHESEASTESYIKVKDIAVNGNDVFIVGQEYPNAILWKNGTPISLSDGMGVDEANRIKIIGTDIHIIGTRYIPGNVLIRYWKNEILTSIGNLNTGAAIDFTFSESDIFITGYKNSLVYSTERLIPKYWRNDIEHTLSNSPTNRYGASIEVTDDALYILNNEFGLSFPYNSILTKNGKPITPYFGSGVTGTINGFLLVYY